MKIKIKIKIIEQIFANKINKLTSKTPIKNFCEINQNKIKDKNIDQENNLNSPISTNLNTNFNTNLNSQISLDTNNEIEKNLNTNTSLIKNLNETNTPTEKNEIFIDREILKNTTLKKLNENIPLEKIPDETLKTLIEYKVFEDSVEDTVNRIKTKVPEIKNHIEFRNYIDEVIKNDMQDELRNKEGIIILKKKTDHLIKYGIDYHNLRNYEDRDYKVDIKDILEKDLFEKQRVIDDYLENNKEKMNEVLGYYENRIKFTKFNKFSYLIYQNNYLKDLNKIRINLFKNIIATSILSFSAISIYPLLCIFLIPEYYSIFYSSYFLSKTIDQIILHENKTSIKIRTFNFLGFRREIPRNKFEITKMRYFNKIENNFLQLKDKGFLFVTKMLRRQIRTEKEKEKEEEAMKLNKLKREKNENLKNDNLTMEEKDNFRFFHLIQADGQLFYLPADLSKQHEDTNEDLVINILNSENNKILDYDYNTYQDRSTEIFEMLESWNKEYAIKSHGSYVTETEKLEREYSKYHPNRDFKDEHKAVTFRRIDGLDGTFIDNGYR